MPSRAVVIRQRVVIHNWWSRRTFRHRLLLIAAAGLSVRLGYVFFAKRGDPLFGDEVYYYLGGLVLAHGHVFV